MERFTIQVVHETSQTPCPECGQLNLVKKGPRLFPVDSEEPLCRDCAKQLAPSLLALLELAHVAERVGRGFRHMLTPPMEALLDLAQAAENYSHSSPKRPVLCAKSA